MIIAQKYEKKSKQKQRNKNLTLIFHYNRRKWICSILVRTYTLHCSVIIFLNVLNFLISSKYIWHVSISHSIWNALLCFMFENDMWAMSYLFQFTIECPSSTICKHHIEFNKRSAISLSKQKYWKRNGIMNFYYKNMSVINFLFYRSQNA